MIHKKTPIEIESLAALPTLLTARQVCQLRSCCGGTLHRARKDGKVAYTQVNARVYLYHRDSILKWLGFKPQWKAKND